MTAAWHVIQTLGGREGTTADELKRRNREFYYPRAARTVLHARRKDLVERPLYPTYLFCRFDPKDLSWGEILHVPGVFTILGIARPSGRLTDTSKRTWQPFAGTPRPVPHGVVEGLRRILDAFGGVLPEPTVPEGPPLEPGDDVFVEFGDSIMRGLVDAHVGVRVRVLLDVMGRSTPVIVPRDSVSLAPQP